MSKFLQTNYKKGDLIILILACLAILVSLYATTHNGFMGAKRLLNEFAAYSGLDWMSPLNPSQDTQHPLAELAVPLQGVIRNLPRAGKMVAITFDDGPSRQFTPLYLKTLNRYGAHATFFLIGRHIQEDSGLASMIAGSGNELGNHTFVHRNLEQMDSATAKRDIASASQLIEQDTHRQVFLFRPPGGHLDQPLVKMIDGMGLKIILWSIDPRDWDESLSPEQIIDNVLANLKPGSIVLLHEGKAHTLAALPTLIKAIRQRGYQLVTISELLASQGVEQPKPQVR